MKKLLAVCLFFTGMAAGRLRAQEVLSDSTVKVNPAFGVNRYYELLKYHDPVSYLAFPLIRPLVNRSQDLRNGEGKNGYWAEGYMTNRFTIYRGKYFSRPLFQRIRATFDVGMMPRLTRDTSNPLLPFNNSFGLGLDFSFSRVSSRPYSKRGRLWATAQLHHLSNGQADSFFIDNETRRNNYRGGDFSTNYYRLLLKYARQHNGRSFFSAGFGYQQEINIGGPLILSRELEGYYGFRRLLFGAQWIRPSRLAIQTYRNLSTPGKDSVSVVRQRQVMFRSEVIYIMDNLDQFPGKRKYRLGWHNYFTYMPSANNDVGLMAHLYAGRDYLNIRFDDIVLAAHAGVFVRIR